MSNMPHPATGPPSSGGLPGPPPPPPSSPFGHRYPPGPASRYPGSLPPALQGMVNPRLLHEPTPGTVTFRVASSHPGSAPLETTSPAEAVAAVQAVVQAALDASAAAGASTPPPTNVTLTALHVPPRM